MIRATLATVVTLLTTTGCAAPRSPGFDRIAWDQASAEWVLRPGQLHGDLDSARAAAAHVIRVGDRYRMYYWGTGSDGFNRILLAEAPVGNPNRWRPLGSVLERQPQIEHNIMGPSFPFVVPRDDGPWLMYVCAWGKPRPAPRVANRTCVAVSHDGGFTWRYADHNPVLPLDQPYDSEGTGSVCVTRGRDGFRMFYTALAAYYGRPAGVRTGHGDTIPAIGIGLAVSSDGVHWRKPLPHWLIAPRRFDAQRYEYICSKPFSVEERAGTRLWVNTFDTAYRVRSLTSHNGGNWTWAFSGEEGEVGTGRPGSFDDRQRSYPCVVKHGDEYRCWYTGNDFGLRGIGYIVGRARR